MGKQYAPHEPAEELLSAEDAFRDADSSESRWRAVEHEQGLRRVMIELEEPVYWTLEELAKRQSRTVPRMIEEVISELLATFGPSSALESK